MAEFSSDEAAVRELFDRTSEAWERADADLFASAFAADADFINITAAPLRGREEIVQHHARLWATIYKGSKGVRGPLRVRLVHPDVAVVESEVTLKFGEQERHAHALSVAVRNGEKWELAATHNMLPFVPPQT